MKVRLFDIRGRHQDYVGTADQIAGRLELLYPAGTEVTVWRGSKSGPGRRTRIRAWGELENHTFGAWMESGGFIALSHLAIDEFAQETQPAA